MKPEEIKARLEKGENPIALSIEHWERNLRRVKDDAYLLFQSSSCALCYVYITDYQYITDYPECPYCPFVLYGTQRCDAPGSLWRKVVRYLHASGCSRRHKEKELIAVIENLITKLQRFLELEQQAQKESNEQ